MAIRTVTYTVSESGIVPAVVQNGGLQGEHKATELVFYFEENFRTHLGNLRVPDGVNDFYYRFEAHNGAGLKDITEPKVLSVRQEGVSVSYELENWLTREGGNIRVYLVISYVDTQNDENLMDIFTYPALLRLENVPEGELYDGTTQEGIAEIVLAAKSAAKRAEESVERAAEKEYECTNSMSSAAEHAKLAENAKNEALAHMGSAAHSSEQAEAALREMENYAQPKEEGKGLSSNDFTDEHKNMLENMQPEFLDTDYGELMEDYGEVENYTGYAVCKSVSTNYSYYFHEMYTDDGRLLGCCVLQNKCWLEGERFYVVKEGYKFTEFKKSNGYIKSSNITTSLSENDARLVTSSAVAEEIRYINISIDESNNENAAFRQEIRQELDFIKEYYGNFSNNSVIYAQNNYFYEAIEKISNLTIYIDHYSPSFSVYFTLADEGDITITLPECKYIGGVPSFANGETWELNFRGNVVVGGKVE